MTESINVEQSAATLEVSPRFQPITKVVLIVGESEDENGTQIIYESGNDTGRTLEITNPWGTQEIADYILAQISGYEYQPFNATGAIVDPAAELGDSVEVNGLTSILASQSITFDSLSLSNISAPNDEELDHEYPYESHSEKQINRKIAKAKASLKVEIDAISAEVHDEETGLAQLLRVTADGVLIKNGDGSQTFIDGGSIIANSVTADQIDATNLHVSAANVDGSITFSQLDSNTQNTINGASTNASNANSKVAAWTYSGTTYIDGTKLMTGTVTASVLQGGTVKILQSGGSETATITTYDADTGGYAMDITSNGSARFIARSGTCYISSKDGKVALQGTPGAYTVAYGIAAGGVEVTSDLYPGTTNAYHLGVSARKWTDVYSNNSTIQTSDRNEKKDIEYGLDRYNSFFDGLAPCTYRFVDGHERIHFGMIAQDIEELIDHCGLTSMEVAAFIKSKNEETGENNYGLRYGEFVSLLVDQVQRLKKRVKKLEAIS